ncbi:MAG: putative histidine kinase, classic, partial [Verrucomicrobiales bacterium]|nr:putative histidine kinase, classic [Verrucomicrobiales bacterium]
GAGGLGDWNWEAGTDLVRMSDRAADILEFARGTPVTWSKMRENLHEEDRENARLAVERSLSEHSLYSIEYRVNRPSGEIKWIAAMGRGTYGEDGTVLGMVGMVEDITERRRSEESLREESRILELLNETGKLIASQLELQGLLQQVTDAATKLSGAKFGAFFYNTVNEQGESFVLYTLCGAPREAFEKFGLPRATPIFKPTFHAEGVVRSDDITQDPRYGKMAPHHGMPRGHLPVVSYLAVPVVSRSGEVIGGLFFGHPERAVFTERSERLVAGVAAQAAVAIDNARLYKTAQTEIAERQRIAEDLQKAREELSRHAEDLERQVATRTASLREAVAQLEEFSYTVSHDLRAPLRAIGGYNEILRKDYGEQLPEDAQSYLAKIGRSSARMERLVHDVLTMSRVARAELKVHPISLQEFIEEIVEQHPAMQSPAAEVQIQTPHRVMADDTSLSQAIGNLLSNAVKFMPEGTKPVVMVRSEQAGQEVRLWIEDNGIGIPEKHRRKLFVMFQRLPAMQQYEGTGIGLAIVRKAVERMGGTVGIEENQSQGSRFWLQLKGAE